MLARGADNAGTFTRRDLVRLTIASVLLIATLTVTLAVDVAPSGLGLAVGAPAPESIRAPRALTYESRILTDRARSDAADGVPPQYDYSPERGSAIAAEQIAAFNQAVAGADAAFGSDLNSVNRADLLRTTLSGLSDAAHETLIALSPARWQVVRGEAKRVLDEIERTQL